MWDSEIDPGARSDYDETVDWYLAQDPATALRFIQVAKEALASMLSDPERFATITSGVHAATIKGFPVQIVYRVRGTTVQVLAYYHASRRPGYWTNRLDG